MNKVQCKAKGHFYDADLYRDCPICHSEAGGGPQITAPPPKTAPHGPAPVNANLDVVFCTHCGSKMPVTKQFCTNCGEKLRIPAAQPAYPPAPADPGKYIKPTNINHTSSIWAGANAQAPNLPERIDTPAQIPPEPGKMPYEAPPEIHIAPPNYVEAEPASSPAAEDYPSQTSYLPQPEQSPPSPEAKINAKEALRSEVASVTSYSASEDTKTVAYYDFGNDESPVVGWIVCIKGKYQGQGFDLKSGQNYIGRAMNMGIALAKEESVSRDRHAAIIFDPAKQAFFIQHGESTGLTWLNGELVMEHTQLSAYDKIKLGTAEFVFVPFCGEKFTWDDYLNQ